MERETYKKAGVDIKAASDAVKSIKKLATSTFSNSVLGDIGPFAALYKLGKKYNQPVLVSGTDGVGTKLVIAQELNIHNTVGIDLVAMCVNDILTTGAEPLFFLDYIACDKIIPKKIADIVKGIAKGCREAECSLIGGETAEMPGFYKMNQYDLAGFAVGVVERKEIITGEKIKKSDLILCLPSNGLHSNGFSLVRKLIKKSKLKYDSKINPLRGKLGKELLKPTSIYVKQIKKLKGKVEIKGMAHITGGGISENAGRILPDNTDALIDTHSWRRPPIFNLLQNLGKITDREMFNTFNMGIGFVIVIGKDDLKKALDVFKKNEVLLIGEIIKGEGEVLYE